VAAWRRAAGEKGRRAVAGVRGIARGRRVDMPFAMKAAAVTNQNRRYVQFRMFVMSGERPSDDAEWRVRRAQRARGVSGYVTHTPAVLELPRRRC